jgi:two-component system sensor kinase FixL
MSVDTDTAAAQAGLGRDELDALMEAAVDAIVVIRADGGIVAFSRAAERMFGYRRDEIVGRPIDLLMPDSHRKAHAGYIERYQATGEPHIIGIGREVEALRRSGELFPAWLSVGEVVTPTGRRYVGIVRDMTGQRKAELERHALEVRLAHVSRLSLLGEMAAGIAHEINQPLTAISNYSQAARNVLERGLESPDTLRTACSGIAEQVQRAGEVIQNLRKFVRKREIEKQTLSVRSLIEGVMVLVNADATHAGVSVITDFAKDLPAISGNAVQLQQVLLNLTRNAVDAMRESRGKTKEILIETCRGTGDTVAFRVSDRGPGVPSNLEEAIFHPFFTTKEDGLGVGLAISRSIIESHGGNLSYEPRVGGGSTFVVSLPILAAHE